MSKQGHFAEVPFPELLLSLHNRKFSGTLQARDGKVEKEIYLEDGEVKFAFSNAKGEKIGNTLVRNEKITEGQLQYALTQASEKGERVGKILVDAHFLKPKDLLQGVKDQIKSIVTEIFTWSVGDYDLLEGQNPRAGEMIKLHMPIAELIMEGVHRMTDPRQIIQRVGSMDGKVLINMEQGGSVENFELAEKEQEILALVNGQTPIRDICNALPFPAIETCQILYALIAAGIVKKAA